MPRQAKKTPEQLGIGQTDPKVLRLPDGLEEVGDEWFRDGGVEKLVVPNSVKTLGESVFFKCKRLREVFFEPDSRLETIGYACFGYSGLVNVVVPKSVQYIGSYAFCHCPDLASLRFEEGSMLGGTGRAILVGSLLQQEDVQFPEMRQKKK